MNIFEYAKMRKMFGNSSGGSSSGGGENKLAKVIDRTATEITAEDLQGATKIGVYAFYNCSGLTSINIPNNITSIGTSAFFGCSGLTSITIPNSVKSFDNSIFQNCTALTSVNIPEGVTKISNSMFAYCLNLASITIPSTVTVMDFGAFKNCGGLKRVKILATTPPSIQSNTFVSVPSTCVYEVPAASYEAYKAATNWSALNIVASEEF